MGELDGSSSVVAPWSDFAGNQIRVGDLLLHPTGECGEVIFDSSKPTPEEQWRVDYGDGFLSLLCLQIGEKGQARVCPRS